jgi:uncharacterized DUF497 family protein
LILWRVKKRVKKCVKKCVDKKVISLYITDRAKAVYTWTDEKNRINKRKHGFYLSDIVDVFDDPHLLEFYDEAHSSLDEDRSICLGCFHDTLILFVVIADKINGDTQIISAREATAREQEVYNDYYRKSTDSGGN